MKKTFSAILVIIWIMDILNIAFGGNYLDVTVPINGLAWLLIWLLAI